MNTIVDRYLIQIKSFLPAKQRDDIVAELEESIHCAVDDRERELGRALDDTELAALLQGFGHPMRIAARYLPMQQLIGPETFPLYWYVLQAVLIVIAVVAGLFAGIAILTAPDSYRAAISVITDFFWFAVITTAGITFAFAVVDQQRARFALLESFDPTKPDAGIWGVRAAPLSPIPRSESAFEFAFSLIFLCWWVGWLVLPHEFRGVSLSFGPAVAAYYYPVIALIAVELVRLGVDYVRPYRTGVRVTARLLLNTAWLGLFALAYRYEELLQATVVDPAIGDPTAVLRSAMLGLHTLLFILGVITAVEIATDIVRLVRR